MNLDVEHRRILAALGRDVADCIPSAAVRMRGMDTNFHLEFGLVETVGALILALAVAAWLLKPKRGK